MFAHDTGPPTSWRGRPRLSHCGFHPGLNRDPQLPRGAALVVAAGVPRLACGTMACLGAGLDLAASLRQKSCSSFAQIVASWPPPGSSTDPHARKRFRVDELPQKMKLDGLRTEPTTLTKVRGEDLPASSVQCAGVFRGVVDGASDHATPYALTSSVD